MEGVSRSEEKVLAGLTDEELVVLDRQEGAHRGWAELERRYARWRAGLVARLARRWRLPTADVPDAQQQAALATREAIARYDLARTGPPNGCRFRTFLGRTVMARFQDYCRNHRRQESHLDRSPEVVAALEAGAELGDNRAGRGPGDPVRTAELKELDTLIERVLGRLGECERRLWVELSAGRRSLAAVAREWDVSYAQVRRVWKRLRKGLGLVLLCLEG